MRRPGAGVALALLLACTSRQGLPGHRGGGGWGLTLAGAHADVDFDPSESVDSVFNPDPASAAKAAKEEVTGVGYAPLASAHGAGAHASVCSDTCRTAKNGICEDGAHVVRSRRAFDASTAGHGRAMPGGVLLGCDLGTDCSDCGPWRGPLPLFNAGPGVQGPIDWLKRQGVSVWARRVTVHPHFAIAYTNPKHDLDVSEQLERAGVVEMGIMRIFQKRLIDTCTRQRDLALGAELRALKAAAALKADPGNETVQLEMRTSMAHALKHRARSPPLVVDVGANFGYFTALAAALGCRVLAVEPVPRFLAFLHWTLAANALPARTWTEARPPRPPPAPPHAPPPPLGAGAGPGYTPPRRRPLVTVVERAVSDAAGGGNVTIHVPTKGIWGSASVQGLANSEDQEPQVVSVPTSRLDELVAEDVELLKVDVEGYEPMVFKSAHRLLDNHKVTDILLEYTPGLAEAWERYNQADPALMAKLPLTTDDAPRMVLALLRRGYKVAQLEDEFAKSGYAPDMRHPFPPLPEVTEKALLRDIADLERFRNYSKPNAGCPWPAELIGANAKWQEGRICYRPPEDSHPKGLRVMFNYNTNLYASKDPQHILIKGTVGLMEESQDEYTTWWSDSLHKHGVGHRECSYLPSNLLLRNRCKCTKPDICGTEEKVLVTALLEGRMPPPSGGGALGGGKAGLGAGGLNWALGRRLRSKRRGS
ncbi:hypothetical protein HYH03_001276 [Edaphochlamys debaryana]|uniref:Methyltransferase FkbM domain-containing protein n=1 Tax=Edaphochlamys debaryana TaxID=47281 RepID=A0A835YFY4_9CHLO|nr:hypothetical protein HYH03_001276 [Edaphochlamys debaryana]|eukprot:KAG2500498.1 hypothetical protein HYH03_001276 [Edaphochlamys debaryana]